MPDRSPSQGSLRGRPLRRHCSLFNKIFKPNHSNAIQSPKVFPLTIHRWALMMQKAKAIRGAAGLMPAAKAEIKRIREEWAVLKNSDLLESSQRAIRETAEVLRHNTKIRHHTRKKRAAAAAVATSEVLRGVVALVEVGAEPRALALRAALSALGASVVPAWTPLVTHLVWAEGGSRETRAKARSLAAQLVSPLWVEACAAAARRLPERAFPAAARSSDLPSPRTLNRLLKKVERNNVALVDLLSESAGDRPPRRSRQIAAKKDEISTEMSVANILNKPGRLKHTPAVQKANTVKRKSDSTNKTNSSAEISATEDQSASSADKTKSSTDKSKASATVTSDESIDPALRVNTAPRRALPASITPPSQDRARKSRRKLFTQREPSPDSTTDSEAEAPVVPRRRRVLLKPSQKKRQEPKSVDRAGPSRSNRGARAESATRLDTSGLLRAERMARKLVQACNPVTIPARYFSKDGRFRIVLTGMDRHERRRVARACKVLGAKIHRRVTKTTTHVLVGSFKRYKNSPKDHDISGISSLKEVGESAEGQRTLSALCGAVRGCRVLSADWALDSERGRKWALHHGYEVPQFKALAQKARAERNAFGLMGSEYGYDVFNGLRVRLTKDAECKEAAIMLLALCGAVVIGDNVTVTHNAELLKPLDTDYDQDFQDGGRKQNGAPTAQADVTIGTGADEVSARWVFDTIAAGRLRNTRRYMNRKTG